MEHLWTHELAHCSAHGFEVTIDLRVRIDFQAPEIRRDLMLPVTDTSAEEVAQRVCRVRRDEQATLRALRQRQCQRRGRRRLAYAPLAAHEDDASSSEIEHWPGRLRVP